MTPVASTALRKSRQNYVLLGQKHPFFDLSRPPKPPHFPPLFRRFFGRFLAIFDPSDRYQNSPKTYIKRSCILPEALFTCFLGTKWGVLGSPKHPLFPYRPKLRPASGCRGFGLPEPGKSAKKHPSQPRFCLTFRLDVEP